MKQKIFSLLCLSFTFALLSCISDDSTEGGNSIPQLSIAGSDDDEMPVKNFNLGEECVISPEITYKDGNDSDLKYEWSIGTYTNGSKGTLEVVSNEKELRYNFLEGGAYYAHLNVTDGSVGAVMDYQININRTFEEGYMLISNDEQGNGNLAFVKTMTAEELAEGTPQIYMEHCIERMNDGINLGSLVGAVHGSTTWPKTINRILVSTEDRCLVLDPNTFVVIAELNYSDVYSDFKAEKFFKDTNPYAYDGNGRYVHINLPYMFAFEYKYYVGQKVDDFFPYVYSMWGGTYTSSLFAKYDTNELLTMNMNSGSFASTGTMLADENIITAFGGMASGAYSPSTYAITQSKTDASKCYMRCIQNIAYIAYYGSGTKTEFTISDDTALPARGAKVVHSKRYNRFYYAIDNRIYVCLPSNENPLPSKSEYAIGFPQNETITFIDMNRDTEELYVATYDETTKRGNFYIYDAADVRTDNQANVKPTATHKACADKITCIVYKPSL